MSAMAIWGDVLATFMRPPHGGTTPGRDALGSPNDARAGAIRSSPTTGGVRPCGYLTETGTERRVPLARHSARYYGGWLAGHERSHLKSLPRIIRAVEGAP